MDYESLYLPAKPSGLLKLGILNLKECENDDRYVIDMLMWHRYVPREDKCHVCLSGAFLAKTLKVPFTRNVLPFELSERVDSSAYALLNFARGTIDYSMQALGYRQRFGFFRIPTYKDKKEAFYKSMEWMATELEKRGC